MDVASGLPKGFDRGRVETVHQGDCLVSDDPSTTYSTVLGSCVAACVRDVAAGVGGMNHFLLAAPGEGAGDRFGAPARYGAFAMEQLINAVLARGSGHKANLEVKVFGGGVISGALRDIGAKNLAFVHAFLDNEGYRAAKEDVGGAYARRLLYKPVSGRAVVRRLDGAVGLGIAERELAQARRRAREAARTGEIELFAETRAGP
jgi:chemotaxis protein CheD